jgi:hypothetical protein
MSKLVGGILLAFGVGALGALAWIGYRLALLRAAPDLILFLIMAVLLAFGAPALAAGWRGLRGRGGLAARGWRMHAGLFALLAAGSLVFAALLPEPRTGEMLALAAAGVLVFAGLSAWCLTAARRFGGSP